ncbi:Pre-rRNA-processing protein esf2 [Fasciola gigantica]|uniref:Pre-rRNA-processing protein esf2 n=1 Tax=Fasciola gigantica TaxID=46835 RepID=A0A504YAG0_FASGI|nr:Pre-rRNA-processing protein esf2 [Fasciola gigantica]
MPHGPGSVGPDVSNEPGVIYLSSIPAGMNVCIVSDIMRQFGEIGRVYLVPKTNKKGKFRQYDEGWVEFLKKKVAKKVAKKLNCCEVPGSKRNPWYGELWNIRFLPDTSWNDLFASEREEQEQRRSAHDRDVILAKRHARQFTAALEAAKLEKKMELIKGKRFNKRKPMQLNKKQKPTEGEILERMARSHRTPPEGSQLSAITNKAFMSSLFSGGV